MEKLFERHDEYLNTVPMDFIRNFMYTINWDSRLICIKGPKGVGKSTLILQKIKRDFADGDRHVLYCSADTGYFSTHTLADTADWFVKTGGQYLFIDEIHKYDGWSQELKEIYDLHKDLHIVVSGSSLLEINNGKTDLSRRMIEYEMPGMSFREYTQKIRLEHAAALLDRTGMSVREAAERWGISERRVRLLCSLGKVEGVVRQGRAYRIPAGVRQPQDGRRRRRVAVTEQYRETFSRIDAMKAELDARLFGRLFVPALGASRRFVGTEPFCAVTALYNETLKKILPEYGCEVVEIARKESGGAPVSASRVRAMIAEGAPGLEALLPEVTLDYLKSPRGEEAAARLRRAAQ